MKKQEDLHIGDSVWYGELFYYTGSTCKLAEHNFYRIIKPKEYKIARIEKYNLILTQGTGSVSVWSYQGVIRNIYDTEEDCIKGIKNEIAELSILLDQEEKTIETRLQNLRNPNKNKKKRA